MRTLCTQYSAGKRQAINEDVRNALWIEQRPSEDNSSLNTPHYVGYGKPRIKYLGN